MNPWLCSTWGRLFQRFADFGLSLVGAPATASDASGVDAERRGLPLPQAANGLGQSM